MGRNSVEIKTCIGCQANPRCKVSLLGTHHLTKRCPECAAAYIKETRKPATKVWTDEVYAEKGYVENLGTIRFKRKGTKDLLRKRAESRGTTLTQMIEDWAWE